MFALETIYSPLRRNTDRESSGQTPVRPWAYSASRIPQQSEPAAQQRETRGVTPGSHGDSPTPGHTEASQETESSPGSQSVGSSQDDQELGGQPTITRQSSDPARGQRRQLPSPKTATPRANNGKSNIMFLCGPTLHWLRGFLVINCRFVWSDYCDNFHWQRSYSAVILPYFYRLWCSLILIVTKYRSPLEP